MNQDKDGPMKELDFDELHQAVSKLMDQAAKPKSKKATKPKEVHAAKPAEPAPELITVKKQPAAAAVASESTSIAVKRVPSSSAQVVVPKRKGIAMDVVQPKPPTAEAPSVRVSRTAPSLQPTQQVKPEAPTPVATPPAPEKPDDVSDDTLSSLDLSADSGKHAQPALHEEDVHKSAFPDPLDVHGFTGDDQPSDAEKEKPAEQPTLQHTAPAVQPQAPKPEEPAEEPAEKPAEPETPFVNAKVEKRPLGAFATTAAEKPNAADELPSPADELAKEPQAVHEAAPPKELSPEVVAVESAEPEFSSVAEPEQKANLDDLRQMSIPQQYKTEEKESAKGTHNIFDTKTYHPPLNPAPVAHRPSRIGGLFTLILIILVVVAAVGAYYFTVGGLDITKIF